MLRPFLSRLRQALALAATLAIAPAAVWAQTTMPAASGEVRDMVLKGDSIEVTYHNAGTSDTPIVAELQVRRGDDELAATVVIAESRVVKAGATVRMRVAIPKLDKGHYTMFAVVDFGGSELIAAQAALDVR